MISKQSGAIAVPIRPLLKNHAFGPDEIRVLTTAFEDTLRTLRLANGGDPVTEIIARKIIELAQQGERDPVQLRERAIDFCRDRLAANARWRASVVAGKKLVDRLSTKAEGQGGKSMTSSGEPPPTSWPLGWSAPLQEQSRR